ncbi:MAG: phage tail tape measure protein [Saprospiraceae bacterium]
MAGGISEYRRQLGLLNDPKLSGSMQREFATRQQTLNARLQTFKNSANNAAIVFGTALLPALTRIMKALTPIIERLSRWMERNQKLVAAIGIALGAFAALSIAMSGIMFIVGGVARTIHTVSFLFGGMGKTVGFIFGNISKFGRLMFTVITQGAGVVMKAFNLLRVVMLANPVIAIVTGIAIAAFLIYKNWDKIKPWLIKLWESVKAIFMKFWEWAKNFFLNYHPVGLIIKHWDKIKMIGTKFFEAGKNIMMSLWNGIKSLAQKPVEAIMGVVKKMRDYLPFSPAKVGPFKDLHKVKIVETIAQAIVPRPLTAAMGSVARAAADVLSPVGPSFAPATQGGGIVVNFQPNITWAGGVTEQNKGDLLAILRQYEGELVRMVESAMEKKARTKY